MENLLRKSRIVVDIGGGSAIFDLALGVVEDGVIGIEVD